MGMGLDTVELIMAVEEDFGIEIENRDAEKVVTVGDLHQLVCEKLCERGSPVIEQELYAQLRDLICEQLGVKPEEVVAGASFVDDLRAD
jgi:acyl carrier protein